ncbi:MAG: hypothetical protein ACK56F_21750, partial [bacterium]
MQVAGCVEFAADRDRLGQGEREGAIGCLRSPEGEVAGQVEGARLQGEGLGGLEEGAPQPFAGALHGEGGVGRCAQREGIG